MLTFRRRSVRRRLIPLVLLLTLALTIWYLCQPPDSPAVLALHFNAWRVGNALGGASPDNIGGRDDGPGKFPIHIPSEVGVLIKTGFGTRHRLREQLIAFAVEGGILGDEGRDFLVVGDWSQKALSKSASKAAREDAGEDDAELDKAEEEEEENANGEPQPGREIPELGVREIHDAVGLVMESGDIGEAFREHERFGKYRSLRGAVDAGDADRAEQLGGKYGWELDALKFIKGMDMAYRRMPHKKWYMILDDDTFVVRTSLQALLRTLDPARPMYLGNSVGDYKARFAHGGSAVLISGAAMRLLFAGRPDVVREAYVRSLDETWGDRLVATTLQRVGVYIAEPYSRFFNGETPGLTRIRPESVCVPIVSFHGLRDPGAMLATGRTMARNRMTYRNHHSFYIPRDAPLLWGELWDLYARNPLETYAAAEEPFQPGDLVGPARGDPDVKAWKGVRSADACRRKCGSRRRCLAWSYDTETRECRGSPWVVADAAADGNMLTGVNWAMAKAMGECLPGGI
ncbi:hypothetical protein E4U37_000547 [Claviceps purpurea]|nr:hypothetical protein E4U37_000547 [Claviceps purpurea]